MRHPKVMKWEKRLKTVFDEIDHELEAKYGEQWPLHPARPSRGNTSNPEHDGLFNVGAAFSIGIGSQHGPGYTVEIRISTLTHVPADIREKIKQHVLDALEEKLPIAFPDQTLHVSEDLGTLRIHGDLSLRD